MKKRDPGSRKEADGAKLPKPNWLAICSAMNPRILFARHVSVQKRVASVEDAENHRNEASESGNIRRAHHH